MKQYQSFRKELEIDYIELFNDIQKSDFHPLHKEVLIDLVVLDLAYKVRSLQLNKLTSGSKQGVK